MGPVAEAVVDLDAVAHNTRLLSGLAGHGKGQGAATMAVVKADAFGHGVLPVARTVLASGATWLGVTSITEARQVRDAGIDAPVLAWLYGTDDDFAWAARHGVDLSVSTPDHLDAMPPGVTVHLKVDTGLTRNGVAWTDWPSLVARAADLERRGTVRVRGIWSHLASADDPGNPSVALQLERFEEALAVAAKAGLEPQLRHLANSAGIVDVPAAHYDLVRAGLALYGVEPIDGVVAGLRRAMTLRARAVNVKRVPPGTGVSYLHQYVTDRDTTVVLVPAGYADGVPRLLSNRGAVAIGGVRCPIAGRVAMDQFVVDAGDLPVALGDEIVLFGPGDGAEPTVEEWAAWAQTNPHEILTGIGARVPRTYVSSGELPHG
ncbi:alanine racemase [Dactylosporangium siamense]|uniref:Alanine racemase n=1 Tax=Dactylosporangium siamense TaxID=685454 RepID=A0A919PZV5_9ACTN|nr:alanine racemase [Dactylosporangium siamense]GIG51335.1 alanine racemase [Dactylosporangium siamense]